MTVDTISQTENVLQVLKIMLSSLAVIFLFAFFIQWKISKYRLPVIAFYMKKRFVRHNIVLGTGIVALSLAYVIEFVWLNIKPLDPVGKILVDILEAISLVCIGFSYYKLMRLQIPA